MLTLRHILEGRNSHEVIYQISRVITSTFKHFQQRQRDKDVSKKRTFCFHYTIMYRLLPIFYLVQNTFVRLKGVMKYDWFLIIVLVNG